MPWVIFESRTYDSGDDSCNYLCSVKVKETQTMTIDKYTQALRHVNLAVDRIIEEALDEVPLWLRVRINYESIQLWRKAVVTPMIGYVAREVQNDAEARNGEFAELHGEIEESGLGLHLFWQEQGKPRVTFRITCNSFKMTEAHDGRITKSKEITLGDGKETHSINV